ncbi:MAG: hypothetical protein KJZ73_03185 [Pseudorhodoplanes sp.]|nr:hypothetical protein [Pseudorhodoplanes sp.]GIK79919.1 MAG: hypothetical protein BroJett024_10240 [Alphaproteobacteria bacterium]
MSRITRNALFALAAVVSLGALSVASSSDALAWGGGGWKKPGGPVKLWPKPGWHKPHKHWHGHWRRHYYYAAPVVVGAGYAAYRAAPAKPNLCSCLTKEYTPEGQVVFKDKCTNEIAIAPVPGVQQQGAAPAPQNFAGRTFTDYQATQPTPPAPPPAPLPGAPTN